MSAHLTQVDFASRASNQGSDTVSDDAWIDDGPPTIAARGIITAIILSVPLWMLIGAAAYALI